MDYRVKNLNMSLTQERINMSEYAYWDVGEEPPFRLSKDRCQRLLHALVACDGRITDSMSFSFNKDGSLRTGIKIGSADALFRITLPIGMEDIFDSILGKNLRTEPPQIHMN